MFYFILGFGATLIGAITGLGGGVFIKPLLDALSDFDAATISVISSFCVFTMAVVSVLRNLIKKVPFDNKSVTGLSIGAVAGGIAGKELLTVILASVGDTTVTFSQNVILVLLMVLVLIYMNRLRSRLSFHVENIWITILIGFLLGTLSAFLGIGGGPINVMVLCLFFGMEVKAAAVNSIAIVLFSQLSKLVTIAVTDRIASYQLDVLLYMLPAAVLGGLLGAIAVQKSTGKRVLSLYNYALIFIVLIGIYNAVSQFFN